MTKRVLKSINYTTGAFTGCVDGIRQLTTEVVEPEEFQEVQESCYDLQKKYDILLAKMQETVRMVDEMYSLNQYLKNCILELTDNLVKQLNQANAKVL